MDKSMQIVRRVWIEQACRRFTPDIESRVMEVDRYSKEIGAATQEQSSGSAQIAMASESLREVTQESMSATDEQATAAEQIVNTMEKMREMINQNASASVELASSAEQLNSQSDRFLQVVGLFVLDNTEKQDNAPQSMKKRSKLKYNNSPLKVQPVNDIFTEVA